MPAILVVEDDEVLRAMLLEVLTEAGYRVYGAANGQEGIDMALDFQPDLILCDILMPIVDGNNLADAVHGYPRCAAIPIIGMSAHRGDMLAASERFVMFLRKPFTTDQLMETIIDLVGPGRNQTASRR